MKTTDQHSTRNILLKLEYCGKDFAGWQMQANERTVQGVLKEKLEKFLRSNIKITGSGRTDAGVHALAQYANFHVRNSIGVGEIKYKLNRLLPDDIVVQICKEVPLAFDSRRSATHRTYRYLISEKPTAINRRKAWIIGHKVDMQALNVMALQIKNSETFGNFCKTKSLKENNDCIVNSSQWSRSGGFLRYEITANRFLHNMVRLLVGSMIAIIDNRLELQTFFDMLECKIDVKAKFIAPAHGLYLADVGYKGEAK